MRRGHLSVLWVCCVAVACSSGDVSGEPKGDAAGIDAANPDGANPNDAGDAQPGDAPIDASDGSPGDAPVDADVLVRDIVADFDASGGGGNTEDQQAFTDFRNWALAQAGAPIVLTMPPGSYAPPTTWLRGIPNLTLRGTGASRIASFGSHIGAAGVQVQNFSNSVRIEAASAGDSTFTVIDRDVSGQGRSLAELMALFEPGEWVLVSAFDLMGYGYPSNAGIHEYARLTSVGANTLTVDTPLASSYPDNLPEFSTGSAYEVDQGGPATVYALDQAFDMDLKLENLTLEFGGGQAHGGRVITYDDCTLNGNFWPSVAKKITVKNSTIAGGTEVDKLLDSMDILSSKVTANIVVQSPEPRHFLIEDSTLTSLVGTAANTVIRRTQLKNLRVGPTGYGAASSLVIEDSEITDSVSWNTGRTVSLDGCTLSGNTITSTEPTFGREWATPGTVVLFGAPDAIARVVDFYQSGGENVVLLDRQLPSWVDTSGGLRIHPCPDVTVRNSTGIPWAEYMTAAPDNIPMYSYWRYGFSESGTTGGGGLAWGKVVSYRVNVTRPYTGVLPDLYLWVGQFGSMGRRLPSGTVTTANEDRFSPRVNLRIAGERVYSASGRTGIRVGDNDTESCNIWLTGNSDPFLGKASFGQAADLSGEDPSVWPEFTVEMVTDQDWQP